MCFVYSLSFKGFRNNFFLSLPDVFSLVLLIVFLTYSSKVIPAVVVRRVKSTNVSF